MIYKVCLNDQDYFYYEEIPDDVKKLMLGNSYKGNELIQFDDLVYVHVRHFGLDNQIHDGELVVNKIIADDILNIFKELYDNKYKIEKIRLIDYYNASDEESMLDNNTSSFNFRNIEGTDKLSSHSYGMAIDINPLYNPFVRKENGEVFVSPATAFSYINRDFDFDFKIVKNDVCYNAFIKRGFTWGGDWDTIKDYQHFEKEF